MCAINGTTKKDLEQVKRMNDVTKHRGPDGTGIYADENVTLGHNRLAIIDLTEKAAQPMQSDDERFVITYNGELYNYRELRRELKDCYSFITESDTEVLLAAYKVWGRDMFPKLKGIFAFAIWDKNDRSLLLARDHMGVKPLYYNLVEGVLTFSSELIALLGGGGDKLNKDALALYLEFGYVPSQGTLVDGISKLPPGHLVLFKDGTVQEASYFDHFRGDGEEAGDDLYKVIDDGVARQLVSDRPIGVFLSGGIDSSVVLHHMSRHTSNVRSFSVDFEMVPGAESEAGKFNTDAILAKKTAKEYGSEHETYSIGIEDVRNNLVSCIQSLGEPNANPTALSQYLLSKWVREAGVVVALGGDGGDELFGGYTRHRAAMATYYFQLLPHSLQKIFRPLHIRVKKLSTPFGAPFHLGILALDETYIGKITRDEMRTMHIAYSYFESLYKKAPVEQHPVDSFMYADRMTWLPEESLFRSDRTSMAHGLELRVPLLDIEIERAAREISVYRKVHPWRGKNILRNIYRKHLPEYLFSQPKRGWISPGAKWIRDPKINELMKHTLTSSYYEGLDSIFDWGNVQNMLKDHTEFRGYYLYPLWNLFVLQVWARQYQIRV